MGHRFLNGCVHRAPPLTPEELLEDPEAISGLTVVGEPVDVLTKLVSEVKVL